MDYIWQIFNLILLIGIGVFIYNLIAKPKTKKNLK